MDTNINKMVNDLNKYNYRSDLIVPIINDFVIDSLDRDDIVFIAKSKDGFAEVILEDGYISNITNVEDRISVITSNMKEELNKNNVVMDIAHLKTININDINYYIYVQKSTIDKRINIQVNTYFLEPKNKIVYQLSILSPTYDSKDFNNRTEMNLIMKLIEMIDSVINNIEIVR